MEQKSKEDVLQMGDYLSGLPNEGSDFDFCRQMSSSASQTYQEIEHIANDIQDVVAREFGTNEDYEEKLHLDDNCEMQESNSHATQKTRDKYDPAVFQRSSTITTADLHVQTPSSKFGTNSVAVPLNNFKRIDDVVSNDLGSYTINYAHGTFDDDAPHTRFSQPSESVYSGIAESGITLPQKFGDLGIENLSTANLPWHQVESLPYHVDGDWKFKVNKSIAADNNKWTQTVWTWANTGTKIKDSGWWSIRRCLGVIECSAFPVCLFMQRVGSKTSLRQDLQLGDCPKCRKQMKWTRCHVRVTMLKPINGPNLEIQFFNCHTHREPPNARLNCEQEAQLMEVLRYQQNPRALALKQGVGFKNDGSRFSAIDVNKSLVNNDKLRYHIKKSMHEMKHTSAVTQGTDGFLHQWRQAQQEHPHWIRYSSFDLGREVIVMQTDEMRSWLSTYEIRTNNQNGYVSDAAHSFFTYGLLMVSCAFSEVSLRWVPIVLSWFGSQTPACYCAHFLILFRSIGKRSIPMTTMQTWLTFHQLSGKDILMPFRFICKKQKGSKKLIKQLSRQQHPMWTVRKFLT